MSDFVQGVVWASLLLMVGVLVGVGMTTLVKLPPDPSHFSIAPGGCK